MSKAPQLTFEIGGIDEKKIISKLGGVQKDAEMVMRRAINRTATHLPKPIKNETLKNYATTNIRKKDIQKTLKVYKTKRGEALSAGVTSIANKKIPLYRFETSRRKPGKNPPPNILARVLINSSMKDLDGDASHSKAFIMKTESGHFGVFERKLEVYRKNPREKHPNDEIVEEVFGPSIPSMIRNKKSSNAIVKDGTEFLQRQLNHEIEYCLRRRLR